MTHRTMTTIAAAIVGAVLFALVIPLVFYVGAARGATLHRMDADSYPTVRSYRLVPMATRAVVGGLIFAVIGWRAASKEDGDQQE